MTSFLSLNCRSPFQLHGSRALLSINMDAVKMAALPKSVVSRVDMRESGLVCCSVQMAKQLLSIHALLLEIQMSSIPCNHSFVTDGNEVVFEEGNVEEGKRLCLYVKTYYVYKICTANSKT